MGKVMINLVEQANSGFLPIRQFVPLKLLIELWFYLLAKFNERREEAANMIEVLIDPAHCTHMVNLNFFGQWYVIDDGRTQTKVQTIDQRHAYEYLVDISGMLRCTCYELHEMIWPCEHIMAWDDRNGQNFTLHFHLCWQTKSLMKLYEPHMWVFLSNDLEATDMLSLEAAEKKGRHRVVRM